MEWLSSGLVRIKAEPEKIKFLETPEEFYNLLMNKTATARRRILLSSLYLGTGTLEQALVNFFSMDEFQVKELESAVAKSPDVQVGVLFDYLRGTRGGDNSSAGILKPLASRINAYFFHTPDLRGYSKQVLPERMNEIVGLQHMKFFIFDDSVIVSGANLSDTYFTNRQDRAVLIEDVPALANYFSRLFQAVASFSFHLEPDGTLQAPSTLHPFEGNMDAFKSAFFSKIVEVSASIEADAGPSDTYLYPFLQMGAFGIHQERDFMRKLFSHHEGDINLTLASGYLNFLDEYADLMLDKCKFPIDILLASPQANGFFGASGVSGHIPALYVYISSLFYRSVKQRKREITLSEFNRPNWSFHAKGLWVSQSNLGATVIGSSNFGYRSTFRDLEAQLLIVTSNAQLRRRMAEERRLLLEHTHKLDELVLSRPDHFVPVWVRFFAKVFRNFF